MPELGALAQEVRSKNAGPFWITVDIFCGTPDAFARISNGLESATVARMLDTPLQTMKRFDIADLNVVKISVPRPAVQGTVDDRDMHGAAVGALLSKMYIE